MYSTLKSHPGHNDAHDASLGSITSDGAVLCGDWQSPAASQAWYFADTPWLEQHVASKHPGTSVHVHE